MISLIRLLLLLSAVLAVSCRRHERLDDPNAPLVIGLEAAYRPFEYVDSGGQVTGVSVAIGREIGKTMGRQVRFENMQFDGLITALNSGSIDLIISSLSATDERRKSIDFSDPYVKTGLSVLVSAKSSVQKAGDLGAPGRRVAVRVSTTGDTWCRANLPQARLIALDTDAACVLEVINGTAEAWVYDQVSVMNYHAQHPEQTRALLAPLRVEQWAVGLRHGSEELKAQVNETLARMRADGSFQRLADEFLATERRMLQEQGQPFVFDLDAAQ